MAYIGNEITQAKFVSVAYTATAAQTTFPSSGALPETAINDSSVIVTINGLVQQTESFSIGTTLVFSAGLDAGDKVEIIWLGLVGSAVVPVDGSVNTSKLGDNAVTLAKLADGTQGDILYYGASGAPTLLPKPGTPADEFLKFATGASVPAWVALAATSGTIKQIVQDTRTSTTSTTSTSFTGNGLSVGITPTASNSKILVLGVTNLGVDNYQQVFGRLRRTINSPYSLTTLLGGDASGTHAQGLGTTGSSASTYGASQMTWCYLDTTNTQTGYSDYHFEYSKQGGTIIYMNRDYQDWGIRGASSIIAMEIGA